MSALNEFDGKQFKSVDGVDAGLVSDEEKTEFEEKREQSKELCEFVKEALDGAVSSCVVSDKLKSHPVFLSTTGQVTLEMEKYFAQIPGDNKPIAEKVLELNPSHPTFEALKNAFETDKERAADIAKILNAQARLIAGLPIDNAVEYCDLVCKLIK